MWKMDGNWQDSSGNGNHGTPINSATFISDGKIGSKAGEFDVTTDDSVEIGDVHDLQSSSFSISAWIKAETFTDSQAGVVSKLGSDGNYRILVNSSGRINFSLKDSSGTVESIASPDRIVTLGEWTHIIVTYDNISTGKIFVNGKLVASKNNFTIIRGDTNSLLRIGRNEGNAAGYFDGKIDDVAIWSTDLLDSDALTIYNRQKQKYASHYDSEVIDLGSATSNWGF